MTNIGEQLQVVREGRAFICERLTRNNPSRKQGILYAIQVLSRELSVKLQYTYDKQAIEITEAGIAGWLDHQDKLKRSGIDHSYSLYDQPSNNPTVLFYWKQTPSRHPEREWLECTIPYETPLEPLLTIFSEISPYFQAYNSHLYHLTLQNLHGRQMRKYEQAIAKRPPEEHQRILKPMPYGGVKDTLPPLLLPHEFDCVSVPSFVSWINYWSPLQVRTVGIDRIRTANWERLIELPNGGFVLAVTEEPLDVTNTNHMKKLGNIVKHLRLGKLQEQHRILAT
ncbi:MAG: hypothetical protein Kow00121_37440 [Elainellaceae cyanobacterium]